MTTATQWVAVRCRFHHAPLRTYEERITSEVPLESQCGLRDTLPELPIPAHLHRDAGWRPTLVDRDSIDDDFDGPEHASWPHDLTELYYWRESQWRADRR